MEATSTLKLPGETFQPLVDAAKYDATESAIKKSTDDFEAIFMRLVLTEMMPKDSAFFGKGPGASTYQNMFVNAIAEELGSNGALGIGESLRREMSHRGADVHPDVLLEETVREKSVTEKKAPAVGSVLDLAG